ncbi:mediator complex subunit MED14-domain-containing protein [Chlamydoabsidia padenii]|nr:mediator complex subunit MED14-domain-containing protein [Chlamydoabsidia padenii]
MASMVPLRTLVGKMINKSHAELMTLTDTLPSMSEVERKRQILNYTTFTRKQFLKLTVLMKWAKNADDIQMCQNVMSFLANQNRMFQETVDWLHRIHVDLPGTRVRNFDILTAVDVLSTGTYQKMPTKIEDMLPPTLLTDRQVLETFEKMNDDIRVRMLTKEVLPSTMQKYRIENGRVYFCVENEFEVALTLMGNSNDRKWWIVSLDILIRPSSDGSASDVDISLNEGQRQRLRANAQRQLVPPETPSISNNNEPSATNTNPSFDSTDKDTKPAPEQQQSNAAQLFFPLVNLYDYLHLFCLNMQLEIVYMQATMMAKSRWLDQLKVHMNPSRTSLTLIYWGGGSATAQWGSPQGLDQDVQQHARSSSIEISVKNEDTGHGKQSIASSRALSIAVRDEYKGLIQKCGIGASVLLADLDEVSKTKVYNSLKYPKTCLDILWSGNSDLHTDQTLLNPTDMNVEKLISHVTTYHKESILTKFRQLLKSEASFLKDNGLHLVDNNNEENLENESPDGRPLVVRYRHDRYIYIDFDSRVGRVKVCETEKNGGDGNVKLGGLEDRLNTDPSNIGHHLLWLRSGVVVHEIVSLAKQLNLQPFHPSHMQLRPDDILKLFGDLPGNSPEPTDSASRKRLLQQQPIPPSSAASVTSSSSSVTSTPVRRTGADQQHKPNYPQHCVFLQFSQFEDWYLVIAVIRNEFQPSLCCLRKTNDQNAIYQEFVDLIHVDHDQVWKERFINGRNDLVDLESGLTGKSHQGGTPNDCTEAKDGAEHSAKRRRTLTGQELLPETTRSAYDKVDNLSVDLPFLAKLESLSRAFITNRKIELQLHQYRTIRSYTRPFIKSFSGKESRSINHPSADRMEVLCISQNDLLKTCAYRNVDMIVQPGNPGTAGAVTGTARMDLVAWVDSIAPRMTNEIMLRASGWWTRGRKQCFVEIQDKVDWRNIPLKSNELCDHISLDSNSSVLSFTYSNIDSCIDRFLTDWERVFMMANLSRQVSSLWFKKYQDQLSFEPCDMQTLTFTYAKDFVCNIRWDSPSKGQSRRYIVDMGTSQNPPSQQSNSTIIRSSNHLHSSVKLNPHWRVISFLQDILNDKRDLVYFVQMLFQTLPLMASLQQLESDCTQKGDIGRVCIIPRASDSVRIMFSYLHGIDVRFHGPSTLCISDAAFHHAIYRTLQHTSSTIKPILPPAPYIPPSTTDQQQEKGSMESNNSIAPISVTQQVVCKPFAKFDKVLEDLEQWIFMNSIDDDGNDQPWYLSGQYCWPDTSEPSAIPFEHGLLCSASLCRNVILKLQQSCLGNSCD